MTKTRGFLFLLVILLLLPLWMWLAWVCTPRKKMVVAIVDKTVLTPLAQEHISLDWILRHEKFTKTKKDLYEPDHDYFGFFPGQDDHFKLKGLERFSSERLKTLAGDADGVYFTDTYGIYKNEWYKKTAVSGRSGLVYGGMSPEDIGLLENMKARHKLMIAEFNTIGSPTATAVRTRFERLFGMHWTGWTARYFSSLDTSVNSELPHWLVGNYRLQHEGAWPFHHDGIAFVSNDDQIVVLETSTGLLDAVPVIESTETGREALDLPRETKYPFWFDITDPNPVLNDSVSRAPLSPAGQDKPDSAGYPAPAGSARNEIGAEFVIHANAAGAAELKKHRIPLRFPAVLFHQGEDYRFYYFSGDFCDNPIGLGSSPFKGISFFSWLFYDTSDPNQRVGFFWNFYRPMMNRIFYDYYRTLPKK
ncbi:MAG: hypothetical protein P4L51_28850 [Puia sp.]|nr:hypothetical protein [Puia sp.]